MYSAATVTVRNSKIGITAIDSAMGAIPFKYSGGSAIVNDIPWRKLVPDMRTGKIRNAFKKMDLNTNIKARDEAAFKKLLSNDVPDIKVDQMETNIAASKPSNPGLDIPPAKDGTALKESLSPSDQMKVEITMEKFKKYAVGGAVAGIIAVIAYGGISLYEDLNRAAKERNGCYIIEYKLGNAKGCKITNRSCELQEGGTPCSTKYLLSNIYIFLNHIVQAQDQALKDKIFTDTGDRKASCRERVYVLV